MTSAASSTMATVVALPRDVPSRDPTPPPSLTLNTGQRTPAPVPNKHIPFCSPGPIPTYGLPSPPASPPSPTSGLSSRYVLFPPDPHSKLCDEPAVYTIPASTLADALEQAALQPLPDPSQVFPWLHGLHEENHIQLSFFGARRKISRRAPRCLRGLTVVKAGGNLEHSRIKGAVAPEELLPPLGSVALAPCFHDLNPRAGFSVRNFQIQTCKLATVSDIVVYGDASTPREEVELLAKTIAQAQINHRIDNDVNATELDGFNTFVVTDNFDKFETDFRDIVAVDSKGQMTGSVMNFTSQERVEMNALSRASEIAPNTWLGPTPDPATLGDPDAGDGHFDIMIEASDLASIPVPANLDEVESFLADNDAHRAIAHLEFPSSGSFAAVENGIQHHAEVNRIIQFFHWIHKMTNCMPVTDKDGDTNMSADKNPKRVLIHCQDGYTETSLMAVAYSIFAHGLPAHQAWLRLHTNYQRNFFAYPTDKFYLENVQLRLLQESPALHAPLELPERPTWMQKMDGSLPSRIMSYLYLGNLNHAQNPDLLQLLGITRVLSIGEPLGWTPDDIDAWGVENLMFVDKVQDNGVDPLTADIEKCLAFIADGKKQGKRTLVHCRVGVSRSATICIAEVMNETGMTFPRAYCFVRARRLNVIIQPHLRFSYELLKYEEAQKLRRGLPARRELEWATIAREIALMNKPYCRQ